MAQHTECDSWSDEMWDETELILKYIIELFVTHRIRKGNDMILFINACVREQSRTLRLAKQLLDTLDGEIKEVKLDTIAFPVVDEEFINRRDALKNAGIERW